MLFNQTMRELPVSSQFTWLAMKLVDTIGACVVVVRDPIPLSGNLGYSPY
jgi:hypothetical protein